MIPLPKWAVHHLLSQDCVYCNTQRKIEWICGIGIREIKTIGKSNMEIGNYGLYFEYMCYDCNRVSMTVIDLNDPSISANDIIKEIADCITLNKSNVSLSKISDEEVIDMKKNLPVMDHNDFLKYIGISDRQIDEYKLKDDYSE